MENTPAEQEGKTIYWEVVPPEEFGPMIAEAIENVIRQKLTLARGYYEISTSTHPSYIPRQQKAAAQVIPALEQVNTSLQLIETILKQGASHALPIDRSASKPRIALDHIKALEKPLKQPVI